MSSSYYDQQKGNWNTKVPLGYGNDVDPYTIAVIALTGVWLLALLIVAAWATFARTSKSATALSIFKVYKYWLALVLTILNYAFDFAYLLVVTQYDEVTAAYLLVQTIFGNLKYLADVVLLVIIYGIISQLLQQPKTGYSRHRGFLYAHYALCFVLFALYIAMFGVEVHVLYNSVFNADFAESSVDGRPIQSVLTAAYDALYAFASLEVLAISIGILVNHRIHGTNHTTKILVVLIAIPLFVEGFFVLGYTIAFYLEFFAADYRGLTIAMTVIKGLACVLEYAGLVAIGLQHDNTEFNFDVENRAVPEGQFAPSHAPPNVEPAMQSLQGSLDKEHPVGPWGRVTEWRPSLPNMRKGGKSSLGLPTAF